MNISTLTVAGGHSRLFKSISTNIFNMQLGELITHSIINTNQFKWSGGQLHGYSGTGSELIVQHTGSLEQSNDVTLDGLNIINNGELLYHGADIVFNNAAQLTNFNHMSIQSNSNFYAGNSDSGTIVNYGTLDINSPTLHIPLINHGIINIQPHHTLTVDQYVQSSANAALYNNGNIIKSTGQLSIRSGTLYMNGKLQCNLDMNGRLVVNSTSKIDGDVIFSNDAILDSNDATLNANTVYLAGQAHLDGKFDAVVATQLYNVC